MDVVAPPYDDTFSCGILYNTHSLSGFSALAIGQLGFSVKKNIFDTLGTGKTHYRSFSDMLFFFLVRSFVTIFSIQQFILRYWEKIGSREKLYT